MTTQRKLLPASPGSSEARHDTAKTALVAGGLLAAFGVASCCALPIALSIFGISAAFLVGIGTFAAQYQRELFYAAVVCLGGAAFVMWRQSRARACAPGGICERPALRWVGALGIAVAVGLLGLTFWIDPPI
jgi:mercuric ion transport protein